MRERVVDGKYERILGTMKGCAEENPQDNLGIFQGCVTYFHFKIMETYPTKVIVPEINAYPGSAASRGFYWADGLMMLSMPPNPEAEAKWRAKNDCFNWTTLCVKRPFFLPNKRLVEIVSYVPPKFELRRVVGVHDEFMRDFVAEQVREINDKTGLDWLIRVIK